MTTGLFNSSLVGSDKEALDFIGNILESSIEYSFISKDVNGEILVWNEGTRRLSLEPIHIEAGNETSVLPIDISDRQKSEAMLQLQSRALRAAANGIVITDPTGKIEWVNEAFTKLTGYTAAEMIGQNPRLLKSAQHDVEFYRQLWTTITAGRVWRGEMVNKRKDGRLYYEDMTITPVLSSTGAITHFIAIKQDVTERKQAQMSLYESNQQLGTALQELKTAQRQLVQQENLRSLGQMASGIAHDFNNALGPILGLSDLLLESPDRLGDQKRTMEYLDIIRTCARDAASVVRRMREFGRKQAETEVSSSLDLAALVQQTLLLTEPRWKTQAEAVGCTIKVETNLQPVPPVTGEESGLREMLTNLIFNAVDAMPDGGTITLSTGVQSQRVVLQVRDTGTGMTPEVQQHCLEPFYTTKGENGTGLGLSMVYGIVQRHKGTLDIESEPGRGTVFSIRFPVQVTSAGSAELEEVSVPSRLLRVLVVDDEPLLRDIITAFLEADGHTVETAGDGQSALAKFGASQFDLVITDKAMSGMNGERLAAAIHDIVPGVPIVMATGFGDLMKADGEMPSHVTTLLAKPFTRVGLRTALAKALMGRK